tara:strand:- start:108 stop:809 length:702 start_codon:yes stop_codon:yes gene_type:complete
MAKFVKGDWVRIQPHPDWYWNYWTDKHTAFCDKVVEVVRTEPSKNNKNVIFIGVRHFSGGKSMWFQDKHCIAEESYDRVFAANMQRAVDKLNQYEAVAKKCRDDILRHVFGEESTEDEPIEEFWCDDDDEFFDEWDDEHCDEEDELEEDWENVITKPVVPLPGSKKKTIIRKGSGKGSAAVRKALSNAKKKLAKSSLNTQDIEPADWMTDEELYDYLSEVGGDDKMTVWGDPD